MVEDKKVFHVEFKPRHQGEIMHEYFLGKSWEAVLEMIDDYAERSLYAEDNATVTVLGSDDDVHVTAMVQGMEVDNSTMKVHNYLEQTDDDTDFIGYYLTFVNV